MTSSRRTFLGKTAKAVGFLAAGGSTLATRMMAATTQSGDGYKALVVIDLEGGNDGNNTLVPFASEQYAYYSAARQALALDRKTLLPIGDGLGGAYGLHPSLTNLRALYSAGNAAFVANVGTLVAPDDRISFLAQRKQAPAMLQDHEVQRAEWATASALLTPTPQGISGWGGRMADSVSYASALGFPILTSLTGSDTFAVGDKSTPASVSPSGATGFPTDGSRGDLLLAASLDSGSTLVSAAAKSLRDALGQTNLLNSALAVAPQFKTAFPTTSLGVQLKQVAAILTSRSALGMNRQIFLCKLLGFDHHEKQLNLHAGLLSQVDQALGAFMNFLEEVGLMNEVTVFTQSDFGRCLAMNGSLGSDHAWGNHQIVLGGALKGNRFYGKFPSLEIGGSDDFLQTGGWIPTTSVEQYGTPLASWFGVPNGSMGTVFPNMGAFEQNTIPLFG